MKRSSFGAWILPLFILAACSRVEGSATPDPVEKSAKNAEAPASAVASASPPLILARGLRFVKPKPEGDVAKLVQAERAANRADGRDLLVYVGAKWCEPCRNFHAAVARGELDSEFPDLSILEFDLDEDRDRLVSAGYQSKLIPLFVFPGDDGRASGRRFEGSVKGNGAVANISPRLHQILAR